MQTINQSAFKRPSSTSPRPPKARSQSPASSDDDSECSSSESYPSIEDLRDFIPPSNSTHNTRSPKIIHRQTTTYSPKSIVEYSPESLSPPKPKSYRKSSVSSPQKSCHIPLSCFCCFAVVLLLVLIYSETLHSNAQNVTNSEQFNRAEIIQEALRNLGHDINEIRSKFEAQDAEIWTEIEVGIAEVLKNPAKPAIMLLFSNDEDSMLCLAKMIGNASKNALGSEESLVLTKNNLGSDFGKVIYQFKDRIKQQKVVIVDNLLEIHPEALKAFHNMCDRENPLVGEAIYILTMVANGYKNEPSVKFVEDQLTKKLRGNVDDEKLQPLITRITDGAIVHVQPEPGIRSCPIRY